MSAQLDTFVAQWTQRRLCVEPGFYAGRPPSTDDISFRTLEDIYQGLRKDIGDVAAANFVRLVNSLDDMSASSLMTALHKFWAQHCTISFVPQRPDDRITVTPVKGKAQEQQLFAVVADAMVHGSTSEEEIRKLSSKVKNVFIHAHLDLIPESERRAEKR